MGDTGETQRDAAMIGRSAFDLAQRYWDSGETEKALEQYLNVAGLGSAQEEVFVALYRAARLKEQLERPQQEIIDAYLKASDAFPARAEALYFASRFCGGKGRHEEGFRFAKRGLAVPRPANGLLIEGWIYDWGLLDELAVNAYWSGHYRESLDASIGLLASPVVPSGQRDRFAANARFALEKLPRDRNLGSLGSENLTDQHPLALPRPLRSRVAGEPRVLVAILAKQKEPALPLYLECIEALDYPKSLIVLYIRTNNNTDRTEQILRDWLARVGHLYAAIEFDASDVADPVERYREHEWNTIRFKVLGRIRNASLWRALELNCDFYFVVDVDNFIRSATLRELVALNLPIVSPLLRSIIPEKFYSNYHADVDTAGYYKDCDQYYWILNRFVRGIVEVPLVHCTYLVRADTIPQLTYEDESGRYEYVVFSDSARQAGIPQYLDNRQVYGYITFGEGPQYLTDGIDRARALLRGDHSDLAGKTWPVKD